MSSTNSRKVIRTPEEQRLHDIKVKKYVSFGIIGFGAAVFFILGTLYLIAYINAVNREKAWAASQSSSSVAGFIRQQEKKNENFSLPENKKLEKKITKSIEALTMKMNPFSKV